MLILKKYLKEVIEVKNVDKLTGIYKIKKDLTTNYLYGISNLYKQK